MFGRRSATQLLDEVLKDYRDLAASDPDRLRQLIPEKEIWRFFIEKRCQVHGRHLIRIKAFNHSDNLKLTVAEYIQQVEKIDINSLRSIRRSDLLKRLRKHQWILKPEDWKKYTLGDLLELDRGWMPFEIDEENYLKAMMIAFQEIYKSHEPNVDLLLLLHKLSLSNVGGTNYETRDENPGTFRNEPAITFQLTKYCASQAGIKEFLDANHPERVIELKIFKKNIFQGSIVINAASLAAIKDFVGKNELSKQSGLTVYGIGDQLRKHLITNDSPELIQYIQETPALMEVFTNLAMAADNKEIAYWLYHAIEELNDDIQISYSTIQEANNTIELHSILKTKVQLNIEKYYPIIKEDPSALNKLKAIVDLVYECELDHVFADGNGRTICMLFVNYLLYKAGLPLALLTDSNRFNLYSKEEMLRELIKGMSNTLELVKEGKVFKVDTDDILRQLRSKPIFKPMLDYFEGVQKVEMDGRKEALGKRFEL